MQTRRADGLRARTSHLSQATSSRLLPLECASGASLAEAGPGMGEKMRKPRGKDPITVLLCPQCKHEEPLA